jgi:hypothetical protein
MFDVLFVYCTVVCVSGLSLIQTRRRRIILKTFKSKTLSSLSSKSSVLMHVVSISCIYLKDCMLVIYVEIVGIPMCHIFSCIILIIQDLGRIL